MKKAWKKFVSAVMALLMIGCGKTADPDDDVICGGVTDLSDPGAPKVIQSKEITEFRVNFVLLSRCMPEDSHSFAFQVKPDDNGVLTVTETHSGASGQADDALMTALQEVIDKTELVTKNGIYRLVAGLAPEYGECTLFVQYVSGEKLTFTINNDPEAEWAEMFCDVFADWFKTKKIGFDIKISEGWEE